MNPNRLSWTLARTARWAPATLAIATCIMTAAAGTLSGPPGVPTTPGRGTAASTATPPAELDAIALLDLRTAPRDLLPILENPASLLRAWKPSPSTRRNLELRRRGDWFITAGSPDAIDSFRTWYATTLSTASMPVEFDIRVIELPATGGDELLTSIRRDPRGAAVQDLARTLPTGATLLASGRMTVGSGGSERLEWDDPSGPRTTVEIGVRPGSTGDELELRIDAETSRSRTLGRRTDRTGARATDRRRRTTMGTSVATTTGSFAESTVRMLDGGRRTLPSAAPENAAPVVVIATPSAGTAEGLRATVPTRPYVDGKASRDGTGRRYFDREIAQVMGHMGAAWLERPEREREERTDLLLSLLPIESGDTVADIGAGSGYFTRRLARMVGPDGTVLATDIQPEMLQILDESLAREGIDNVTPILGTITDTGLEPGSVDLILLVDVYHEFDHPWEMSRSMRRALKPDGVVALVEYRAGDPQVPIKPLHTMTAEQSRLEFEAAGFSLVGETVGDLPWQRLQLFAPAPRSAE